MSPFFHARLSVLRPSFNFMIFVFCVSCSTSSIHVFIGLPLAFFPSTAFKSSKALEVGASKNLSSRPIFRPICDSTRSHFYHLDKNWNSIRLNDERTWGILFKSRYTNVRIIIIIIIIIITRFFRCFQFYCEWVFICSARRYAAACILRQFCPSFCLSHPRIVLKRISK